MTHRYNLRLTLTLSILLSLPFFGCQAHHRVEPSRLNKQPTRSRNIAFVADTQFHTPVGKAYPMLTWVADKFQEVAIRPPQGNIINWYTGYKRSRGTSPWYMQHYLLLAEWRSLLDATEAFTGETDPSDEASFKDALEKFKGPEQRFTVDSPAEIGFLRPKVNDTLARYLEAYEYMSPEERKAADLHNWCQLWWASRADAAYRWKVTKVDGCRKLPRGWTSEDNSRCK